MPKSGSWTPGEQVLELSHRCELLENERDAALARAEAAEARLAEAREVLKRALREHENHACPLHHAATEAEDVLAGVSAPPVAPPEAPDALPVEVRAIAYETEVPGVRIESRGPGAWAVVEGRYVLGRDGDWQHEPLPSERTDAFKAATRWPSLADALFALRASRAEAPTGESGDV